MLLKIYIGKIIGFLIANLLCVNCSIQSVKKKSILVVLLPDNNENSLPYTLSFLERLTYPKKQMTIFIRSGTNEDKSFHILNTWLESYGNQYSSIDRRFNRGRKLEYKEEALRKGREMNMDYVWFLDLDVFLTYPNVLQSLIRADKPIVAPMLVSGTKDYSNFLADMTVTDKKVKPSNYFEIINKNVTGCFQVYAVQKCVLVNLKRPESAQLNLIADQGFIVQGSLTNEFKFALNAIQANMDMYICNQENYGYALIPHPKTTEEVMKMIHTLKVLIHQSHRTLDVLDIFLKHHPPPKIDNFGIDHVYVINLRRRKFRKKVMLERLREVGLEAEFFEAFDGKALNSSYLRSIGANQLKSYSNKYMTQGAVGCALSHLSVWKDMLKNNYKTAMVFEDDAYFDFNFREKLQSSLEEIDTLKLDWEFLYMARQIQAEQFEKMVKNSKHLTNVKESYLLVGYILTREGVQKLLSPKFLSEMIPVDDYVIFKSGKYDRSDWNHNYCPCNLKTYSIKPQIVHPTHFAQLPLKVSDTVNSTQTNDETFGAPIGHPAVSAETGGFFDL